jgi:hypothetical protein
VRRQRVHRRLDGVRQRGCGFASIDQ